MSNSINSTGPSALDQIMDTIDLGPTNSIQLQFAQLQLAQSEICKSQAEAYMDKIEENQAKQQEASEMITMARNLQAMAVDNTEGISQGCASMDDGMRDSMTTLLENSTPRNEDALTALNNGNDNLLSAAELDSVVTGLKGINPQTDETRAAIEDCRDLKEIANNNTTSQGITDGTSLMPPEMLDFCEENGIDLVDVGTDKVTSEDEWELIITNMTNYQEQLGTSTQTDMVFLQDFMGQYDSYLQGANKAISDANSTLKSIITR